jgi:hypothetical protein
MTQRLLLILLLSNSTIVFSKNLNLTLIDSDCKMLGPIKGKIDINNKSTKMKTYCKLGTNTTDRMSCSTINPSNDKLISKHEYDVANLKEKEKVQFILGTSKSGNIKFQIDLSNKSYQWGQVNLSPKFGIVTTKLCLGKVLTH